jgi:type IV pilus assembly protein PilE
MKKILLHKYKVKGVTFFEILAGIVIMGILASAAIVGYSVYITKAKMKEAEEQLAFLHTLEMTYHMEHSKYSSDLKALGFQQAKLKTEDGSAYYKVEVAEVGPGKFIGRATSVEDFDEDGQFNVWEIDQDKKLTMTVED